MSNGGANAIADTVVTGFCGKYCSVHRSSNGEEIVRRESMVKLGDVMRCACLQPCTSCGIH